MKEFMKLVFLCMLGIMLIWTLGFMWFAISVSAMKPPEANRSADAIIVLTGGAHRIEEGLRLFAQGKAPILFISGVHQDVQLSDLTRDWPEPLPPCCIELGYAAKNTYGNAAEVRDWLEDKDILELRLVTSEYHMPRARLEFYHALPLTKIYPHPVRSEVRIQGRALFMRYLIAEYHKTIATFLRHHLGFSFS